MKFFITFFFTIIYSFNSLANTTNEIAKKLNETNNIIFSFDKHKKNLQAGLKHGEAIACGANLTKDLGNLPPNICTPSYLASTGVKLAKQYKMKSKVFNQKEIERLKKEKELEEIAAEEEEKKKYAGKLFG